MLVDKGLKYIFLIIWFFSDSIVVLLPKVVRYKSLFNF